MAKPPLESVPLAQNELLVGLKSSEVKAIEKAGSTRKYKIGKTIFTEGDEGTHVFCVISGRVEITIGLGDIDEAPVHVGPAGTVFGEFVLFDGHRRSATARAVKPVKLLAIDRETLRRYMEDNPGAGYRIMTNLSNVLVSRICKTTDNLRASLTW